MLDCLRVTDALPVVAAPVVVQPLTPADFAGMRYNSAVLLPVRFDASITLQAEYSAACKDAFHSYFEDMCEWNTDGTAVSCFCSRTEVCKEVAACVFSGCDFDIPLAWCVGFCVGWLSALSLTDRPLALVGVQVLSTLVAHLQENALC